MAARSPAISSTSTRPVVTWPAPTRRSSRLESRWRVFDGEVVKAGAPDRSNRQVLLVRALAPSGFQKQHFCYGNIISAISQNSVDMIIELSAVA